MICIVSLFSNFAFSSPNKDRAAKHKEAVEYGLSYSGSYLVYRTDRWSAKNGGSYKWQLVNVPIDNLDSAGTIYIRVSDSPSDVDSAYVSKGLVVFVGKDGTLFRTHQESEESIVLPWYQKAWYWYYGIFFTPRVGLLNLAGIVIIVLVGVILIFSVTKAVSSTWHFLDYGNSIEIHGIGTIVKKEFENDEREQTDEEDTDNVEDAEQNESEETTEDNGEGNNYDFSFEIKIVTSAGDKTFWRYVSEEVYDKFAVGRVVAVTYRLGQISKSLEIIAIPELES